MDDLNELVAFVMDKAEAEPVARRAQLMRGLGIVCGDERQTEQFNTAAARLRQADELCRALKTSLVQKNKQP